MQNTKHKAGRAEVRTLKVYEKLILRRSRLHYRNYKVQCPEIRLIGKWLANCGFEPGQHIKIRQEANKLIITRTWINCRILC